MPLSPPQPPPQRRRTRPTVDIELVEFLATKKPTLTSAEETDASLTIEIDAVNVPETRVVLPADLPDVAAIEIAPFKVPAITPPEVPPRPSSQHTLKNFETIPFNLTIPSTVMKKEHHPNNFLHNITEHVRIERTKIDVLKDKANQTDPTNLSQKE
jgi:hypothetical protein